jgi:hypothetical protein
LVETPSYGNGRSVYPLSPTYLSLRLDSKDGSDSVLIMENLKDSLPPGMADAAINIPGVGAILQLLLNKLGFDVGSTMSLYLLLFGLFQGALFMYTQGRGFIL